MANMPGFTYPFPTKELAYQELTYDYCYNKIKEEDKERIVDEAWKRVRKPQRKYSKNFMVVMTFARSAQNQDYS